MRQVPFEFIDLKLEFVGNLCLEWKLVLEGGDSLEVRGKGLGLCRHLGMEFCFKLFVVSFELLVESLYSWEMGWFEGLDSGFILLVLECLNSMMGVLLLGIDLFPETGQLMFHLLNLPSECLFDFSCLRLMLACKQSYPSIVVCIQFGENVLYQLVQFLRIVWERKLLKFCLFPWKRFNYTCVDVWFSILLLRVVDSFFSLNYLSNVCLDRWASLKFISAPYSFPKTLLQSFYSLFNTCKRVAHPWVYLFFQNATCYQFKVKCKNRLQKPMVDIL